MYKATLFVGDGMIQPVHVERITDHSVWINGRAHHRISNWDSYFETHDDAKNYLIAKIKPMVKNCEKRLKNLNDKIEALKALRE